MRREQPPHGARAEGGEEGGHLGPVTDVLGRHLVQRAVDGLERGGERRRIAGDDSTRPTVERRDGALFVVGPHEPAVSSDDLGAWLEEQFGARDERLVTDPDLDAAVEAAEDDLRDRIESIVDERGELAERYRRALLRVRELGEETAFDEGHDRQRELVGHAKKVKRRDGRLSRELSQLRQRALALRCLETLREFGTVPAPGPELRERLFERLQRAEGDDDSLLDGMPYDFAPVEEAFDFEARLREHPDPDTTEVPGEHDPSDGLDPEAIDLDDVGEPAMTDEELGIDDDLEL